MFKFPQSEQEEYGSYNVYVRKNEVQDRSCHVNSCHERITIVVGITNEIPIKENFLDMDNNGEHERFIALPEKIEGKEKSIQNEAKDPQK